MTTPRFWTPVLVFYVVTFLASGVLDLVQDPLHIDSVVIEIVQFAPSIGVVAVLLVWRPKLPALWGLGSFRRLGFVIACAAVLLAFCLVAYAVVGRDPSAKSVGSLGASLWLIVPAQFLGACGEEVGWRGFLQPYLQTRYAATASGVIVGLLWGVWHVQIFGEGVLFAASFLCGTVAVSVLLAHTLRGSTGGNVLIAGTFHMLLNLIFLFVMTEEDGNPAPWALIAVGSIALVTGAVALHRTLIPR